MVYVTSEEGRKFICNFCTLSLCTSCHVQYHDGLTCAMFKSELKQGNVNDIWLKRNAENTKRCPRYQLLIEKIGGCNHIKCYCGAHVCWVCLELFITQKQYYDHMSIAHDGFFWLEYLQYLTSLMLLLYTHLHTLVNCTGTLHTIAYTILCFLSCITL